MSIQATLFQSEPKYASKEELMFSYYLSELKDAGFILETEYQPEPFVLCDEHKVFAYESHNDRNQMVDVKLTAKHVYTADWRILWHRSAEGIFYWQEGGVYHKGFYPYTKKAKWIPFFATSRTTFVDVKGGFVAQGNSSGVTFPLNQKWMMKEGWFIQKAVVSLDEKGIFCRTFTPRQTIIDEIYKRDSYKWKAGDSKLKYEPRLLESFLKL